MIKLGIVTAELMMIRKGQSEIPAIVLVGRDEFNKRRMWRQQFSGYIYMSESDCNTFQEQEKGMLERYVSDIEGAYPRTLMKAPLTKLTLKDPKYTSSLIHMLSKTAKVELGGTIWTYEGDLSTPAFLPIRFLIDNQIKTGIEVYENDPKVFNPKPFHPIDFSCKLRRWYIDFEALSTRMGGSGPKKEDPIPIVTFFDSYNGKLYTLFSRNKNWLGKGKDFLPENMFRKRDLPIITKHHIIGYDTEGLMLEGLANLVNELDPDLFTAWNLDRYDIIKWVDRMRVNHLDPGKLSPFHTFNWHAKPYKIKGRILLDLMRVFKKFTDAELRSYGLGLVAESENLGVEKIPFKKSTQWLWDNDPAVLFNRNVNDVLIMLALDKKYDLIEMFDDLRKEFGAMFSEVLVNYRVIDTALMRMVHGSIALNTSFKQQKKMEKYLGAVVVEPEPGFYSYIAQFDFRREYPSLIVAFNISPETYRDPDYEGECFKVEYQDKVFKFVKSPTGLMPRLIHYFFDKRNEYEKCLALAIKEGKPEAEIKMWGRRVYNMKKTTNAIYGVMDFPTFRLYRQECSAATAILGRIGVEHIVVYVPGIGYVVIYGDTDSVFIQLNGRSKEEAVAEAKKIQDLINKDLSKFYIETYGLESAPTEMSLAKVYDSFLLIAKKNYAGRSFWDEKKGYKVEYDFKGLEIIRSDSSDLEKEVLEKEVRMVLDEGVDSIDSIKQLKDETSKMLISRTIDPLAISYPLQISDPLERYPKKDKNGRLQIPAHIRAAIYSNAYLNTAFERGDKPRRLPIIESDMKIDLGQRTLFSKDELWPTKLAWKGFKFSLKSISINEDVEIPDWFIGRIDWESITERVMGKMDRIKELVKV